MSEIPIAFMALLFAALAIWDWRRSLVTSRVSLGVATVFALGAMRYPGQSVGSVVEHTGDGLAWLVSGARGLGLALVMVVLVSQLRALQD